MQFRNAGRLYQHLITPLAHIIIIIIIVVCFMKQHIDCLIGTAGTLDMKKTTVLLLQTVKELHCSSCTTYQF